MKGRVQRRKMTEWSVATIFGFGCREDGVEREVRTRYFDTVYWYIRRHLRTSFRPGKEWNALEEGVARLETSAYLMMAMEEREKEYGKWSSEK